MKAPASYDTQDAGQRPSPYNVKQQWDYYDPKNTKPNPPDIAYDTPNPSTGGSSTMDEGRVFLGALDRFDFKLVGKKEKFIPYDNFSTTYHKACSREKLTDHKNFPNPECIRWELHRVWQVDYQRRVFFWDEDNAGAGIGENYDAAGKIYRVVLSLSYPYYEHEFGLYGEGTAALDLQTGAWVTNGITTEPGTGWKISAPHDTREFSPDALAGQGVR